MFKNGFMKLAGFDVAAAEKELDKKPLHQIQKDTAYAWGSRAIASFRKYLKTKDPSWLFDGDEYHHESVEHAALVEAKNPKVLKDVQSAVGQAKDKACAEFDKSFKKTAVSMGWVNRKSGKAAEKAAKIVDKLKGTKAREITPIERTQLRMAAKYLRHRDAMKKAGSDMSMKVPKNETKKQKKHREAAEIASLGA